MNQRTAKDLRRIAGTLPTVYIKKPVTKVELVNGVSKIIRTEETATADHHERVKRVYKAQGETGLAKYVQYTHRIHQQQKPFITGWEQQLAVSKKPGPWKRLLSWIKNLFAKF